MKALVLLSAFRDAGSGRAVTPRVEAQAIRLAAMSGARTTGLHAGPEPEAVRDALGHGLDRLDVLVLPGQADPAEALAEAIMAARPDLVLCGNRAEGGAQTGMLPYALAERLRWPLLADAAALARDADGFLVDQALRKGLRRRIHAPAPLIVTVHPAAPPPLPFAYARALRGDIVAHAAVAVPATPSTEVEERPHRPRARIMRQAATGGSAAERLRAATQTASAGGECLVEPDPEVAARAILTHLRRIGAI